MILSHEASFITDHNFTTIYYHHIFCYNFIFACQIYNKNGRRQSMCNNRKYSTCYNISPISLLAPDNGLKEQLNNIFDYVAISFS